MVEKKPKNTFHTQQQRHQTFDSNNSHSSAQPSNYGQNSNSQEMGGSHQQINGSNGGHAIQIAKISNSKLELKQKQLEDILLRDRIRNRAVAMVSIAGELRKGKSFMLNFFLRYLQSGCGAVDDWIGRNKDQPLNGFAWRGGSERHTIGIWMWSEPFIVRKSDGQEVVILLMDTQGTFDSESTVKDTAIIFALTLLTSSTFIYNIHYNLQENNLQNFHFFSDFGRLALSDPEQEKPFQKLVILIRDWSFPYEYPYGKEGGDRKLKRVLEVKRNENNKRVRDFIEHSVQEKTCFLMPHPGRIVATNPDFKGNINYIDPEFITQVESFVPSILAPNNIIVKRIAGFEVSGQSLCQYFKAYSDKFSSGELPELKTLLETTAEVNNLIAVKIALSHYCRKMEMNCGGDKPFMNPHMLSDFNSLAFSEALQIFEKRTKMGGMEYSERYKNDLMRLMSERFEQFKAQNDSKDWFKNLRPPLYTLLAFFVTFFMYYLASSTGFIPLAHVFFILSTVCLGIFVTLIIQLKEGLTISKMQTIIVSVVMSIIALFFLYWRQIGGFFISTLRTEQERNH